MNTGIGLVSTVMLTAGITLLSWLERNLLICPIKQTIGIDCPGCGMQRSILSLLKGDVLGSINYYPATLPIIFLFSFTTVHLKYDFKNGAFFIKMLYIVVALIVVIHYLYKILTNQLY